MLTIGPRGAISISEKADRGSARLGRPQVITTVQQFFKELDPRLGFARPLKLTDHRDNIPVNIDYLSQK